MRYACSENGVDVVGGGLASWCNYSEDRCSEDCSDWFWIDRSPDVQDTETTPDTMRTYFFGHSLINHVHTEQPNVNELAVPHWMSRLAAGNGRTFLADGEFRTNNYDLPP